MRNLIDLTVPVISDPFADLLSIFKISGPHDGSIQAEPFPESRQNTINLLAFSPDRACLVIYDVFIMFGCHRLQDWCLATRWEFEFPSCFMPLIGAGVGTYFLPDQSIPVYK